jgi:hypothetical protein
MHCVHDLLPISNVCLQHQESGNGHRLDSRFCRSLVPATTASRTRSNAGIVAECGTSSERCTVKWNSGLQRIRQMTRKN